MSKLLRFPSPRREPGPDDLLQAARAVRVAAEALKPRVRRIEQLVDAILQRVRESNDPA